jgi:DegV family protein with EDD domain
VTGPPVAVVADSACDLPPHRAQEAAIRLVPLTVTFGEESFLDGTQLSPERFWEKVADGAFPTTASPSPQALVDAYERAAADGAPGVVSVHLSSHLSRTGETARQAAASASVPVEVIDSRSVSMGQGLVALAAAGEAMRGGGLGAVAAAARSAADRLTVAAMLDTVEFLKRGGRVGAARAALSDLLRIRPVLSLEGGEPILAARARTRARALDEAMRMVSGPAERAAVFHAGAPEAAEVAEVAERVADACGVEPEVGLIGAVTGAHLGPRAIGLAVVRRGVRGGSSPGSAVNRRHPASGPPDRERPTDRAT